MNGEIEFLECEIYDSNKYINKYLKIVPNIIFNFQKELKKNEISKKKIKIKIIKSSNLKKYNSKP